MTDYKFEYDAKVEFVVRAKNNLSEEAARVVAEKRLRAYLGGRNTIRLTGDVKTAFNIRVYPYRPGWSSSICRWFIQLCGEVQVPHKGKKRI